MQDASSGDKAAMARRLQAEVAWMIQSTVTNQE
jgi:hypothetical protein